MKIQRAVGMRGKNDFDNIKIQYQCDGCKSILEEEPSTIMRMLWKGHKNGTLHQCFDCQTHAEKKQSVAKATKQLREERKEQEESIKFAERQLLSIKEDACILEQLIERDLLRDDK